MRVKACCLAMLVAAFCVNANAAIIVNQSVAGIQTFDAQGDTSNTILVIETGQSLLTNLTAVGWDVGITPIGASWYSEAAMAIGPTGGAAVVNLTPGGALANAGAGVTENFDSGGLLNLQALGLSFALTDSNGDGSLDFQIEFFETFDDVADAADADYSDGVAGTNESGQAGVDFNITPEPGSALVIAAFGIAMGVRRKR